MQVLSVKEYNVRGEKKWNEACEKARSEGRDWSMMPQISFYIWEKNYGFTAFVDPVNNKGGKAIWHKTKKGVIGLWNKEKR